MPLPSTEALPVRLCLLGPDAPAVDRWIGSLGWQAVGSDPSVPVTPVLALADVPAALDGGPLDTGEDTVLLVAGDAPLDAARAATHRAVREVAGWPDDRDALPVIAKRVLVGRSGPVVDDLRVAGGAGGVGTTTVALALAGLCAWRGRRTLVLSVGSRSGRQDGELEGTTAWRGAEAVPGIAGLRVLAVEDPDVPVGAGPASLVVRDLGCATETDVLVVRRDRAGLDAVRVTTAGVVVVTDAGPAPPSALRRAAAGRRLVTVPWSVRVARAGLRGRVPAGVPGSWLRALEPVVGRGGQRRSPR